MWTVVLFGRGGELDRREVVSPIGGADFLGSREFAKACAGWQLHDGDVIRVIGPLSDEVSDG